MTTKLKLQGLAQTLTKIVPTVTAGNLTLTLQDSNGNTPSTSNPFYVVINNQVRTLTSALSVTLTSGTNWFNAGSSELATYEIDYFAFLGYNATDGVTLGFARIPYPRTYGEFSTSSTDEKYLAVSSRTSATSTDEYTVIGRFAAILSASYVWSIPTYTSINLIQGNILETRKLVINGQIIGNGNLIVSGGTRDYYLYSISNKNVYIELSYSSWTFSGETSSSVLISLPLTQNLTSVGNWRNGATYMILAGVNTVGQYGFGISGKVSFLKSDASHMVLGGGYYFSVNAFYFL